jgi:hypothetical protein
MTTKNFQYAMQIADDNGNLDIDEVVGVKEQIKKQYDCNERTITFNLSLTKATNN